MVDFGKSYSIKISGKVEKTNTENGFRNFEISLESLFSIKNEISKLLNPLSGLVFSTFPLIFIAYIYIYTNIYTHLCYYRLNAASIYSLSPYLVLFNKYSKLDYIYNGMFGQS